VSWFSKAIHGVGNVIRAPDRIVHNVLKGDIKKAASVIANPLAGKQATRDRALRRAAGATAGAVGGLITGGPVGALAGAAIGGARAGKGHGQIKDAAGSALISAATGAALHTVLSPGATAEAGTVAKASSGKLATVGKITKIGSAAANVAGAISPNQPQRQIDMQIPAIISGSAINALDTSAPAVTDTQAADSISSRAGDPLFYGADIQSAPQPQSHNQISVIALAAVGYYLISNN